MGDFISCTLFYSIAISQKEVDHVWGLVKDAPEGYKIDDWSGQFYLKFYIVSGQPFVIYLMTNKYSMDVEVNAYNGAILTIPRSKYPNRCMNNFAGASFVINQIEKDEGKKGTWHLSDYKKIYEKYKKEFDNMF